MKNNEMILGFKVCSLDKKRILNKVEESLVNRKHEIIFNINPIISTNFLKDNEIKKEFNKQDLNIPDGIGIVMASKLKKGKIKERITGIGLFMDICELASIKDKTIFLYGSSQNNVLNASNALKNKYPNLKITGYINGYVSEEAALKEIIKSKPDILFVGLGSPKQEMFIINNQTKLKDISIIMPIGGSMDVVSGALKPAPHFFQKLHLEWLYRMIQEPKRFKQLFKLFKFLLLVLFRNNWYNERAEEEK